MDTTKLVLLIAVVFVVLGCEQSAPPAADSGQDATADAGTPDAIPADSGRLNCGQVAGQTYTTTWTRTMGTCGTAGELDVTVTDPGDLCGAIGQHVPDSLGTGEFSVGCFIDSAKCQVFAAVGFRDCQGEYKIAFGAP